MSQAEMKMINDQALVPGEVWTVKEDHIRLPRLERHLSSACPSSLLPAQLKADDEYAGGQAVMLNRSPQRVTGFCLWGEWRAESVARDKLVNFAADMQEGHFTREKFK